MAATIGLGLAALSGLVGLWIDWDYISLLQAFGRSDFDEAAHETSLQWMRTSGIIDWLLYIATGICFLAWMYGTSRTARSIAPTLSPP